MRRLLLLPLLAAAALVLPACGSSGSGSGSTDPADAAPTNALVYGNVVLRPSGDLKSSIDAAGRKILDGQDPGQKIQQGLDQALSRAHLTYAKDVKPWLGERAGFFLTSLGSGSGAGAAVIDSKDDSKAKSTLEKAIKASGGSLKKSSYKGADLETEGSNAFAVKDGIVAVGTLDAVKASLSARDGSHLSDSSAYKDATDKVAKDQAALFYVDTPKFLDALGTSSPQAAALVQSLQNSPQVKNLGPAAAAVTVSSDTIAFEAPATKQLNTPHPVAGLPSDSWLALSLGSLGNSLRQSLQQLQSSGQGNILGLLENQIHAQTGLSLQGDLLSWLNDASGFVAGSPSSFAAGAILGSRNPAASKRAVVHIGRALSRSGSLPVKVKANGFSIRSSRGDVAIQSKGNQVIAAVGHDAVAKTTHPSSALSSDPTFQTAEKSLGDGAKAALYLAIPTALQYAAAGGSAANIQSAEPYIRHFAYLIYGTAQGSGGLLGRLVIGLK